MQETDWMKELMKLLLRKMMADNSWYKEQICKGKEKELEEHRNIARPINRKILEEIPVTEKEIEDYEESMWRVEQRFNHYDRAKEELN
jgi:hypothetical protein